MFGYEPMASHTYLVTLDDFVLVSHISSCLGTYNVLNKIYIFYQIFIIKTIYFRRI